MTGEPSSEITGLLVDWSKGDKSALDKLIPMVEADLRRLAHMQMRKENREHTLQTTALVNEAYLRLVDQNRTTWQNRAHFFGIAATIMRRILMNYARDRNRQKGPGKILHVSLSKAAIMSPEKTTDLIALDEAIDELAKIDARKADVVVLKFFGGMTNTEVAEVLTVSEITVLRDWQFAKAWLVREIAAGC